jgi:hypothetical protein
VLPYEAAHDIRARNRPFDPVDTHAEADLGKPAALIVMRWPRPPTTLAPGSDVSGLLRRCQRHLADDGSTIIVVTAAREGADDTSYGDHERILLPAAKAAGLQHLRDIVPPDADDGRDTFIYTTGHRAYRGTRRGETCGARWVDLNKTASSLKVSEQLVQLGWKVDAGKPKSEAGDRTIGLDDVTDNVLEAWRKRQIAEQLAYGSGWIRSGRIFTRPDGAELHPAEITKYFNHLHQRVSAAGQRSGREGRQDGPSQGQLTAVWCWKFSQRSPKAPK